MTSRILRAALTGAALVSAAFSANAQDASAAALAASGVTGRPAGDDACPRVVVLRGAEAFPRGASDSHRATVSGFARDCANLGAETLLKVALVGRSARAAGGPSWFNAPLTVAVLDPQGRTVAERRIRLKVALPRGKTAGAFAHVEENLSLPPQPTYAGWTVAVGFHMTAADARRAARTLTAER
ncbi:hypothetical protein GCM10008171_23230 [Methylopila jiangsuensis]|uniref:Uncharacterized protein n=1 Tax=Methylopila jiangsuensis TaxID=586230 RepID=A0A9W6JJ75_9HYPH|nr:hypothetical protein [Methylopila jiangsuensis]MDR6286591.1 hypothetical protein [Methylopila jiangsuensis]GLK77069.1 hypothetical protein GCM10008171_23230 [Methylopila jiangsuensis]